MSSGDQLAVVLNEVGDVVVTDPQVMLALADPDRLRLFGQLQRHGTATTADLCAVLSAAEAVMQQQLNVLAEAGLVTSTAEGWTAAGRGLFFEVPDDPAAQPAARALLGVMFLGNDDVPRRWVAETEPGLDVEWLQAAGLFNARVTLTPQELRDVQAGMERLLEPYTNRSQPPGSGRPVRVLAYFLPETGT